MSSWPARVCLDCALCAGGGQPESPEPSWPGLPEGLLVLLASDAEEHYAPPGTPCSACGSQLGGARFDALLELSSEAL